MQEFAYRLMDNVLALHRDLSDGSYRHRGYQAFKISDPKPRDIHKASVRDRLVHHALYRMLNPVFDRTFISDSYSCRKEKGTHRALSRFRAFAYRASQNHTQIAWVLKCDVRKFFASVDHAILSEIIARYAPDERIRGLLAEVVGSFHSTEQGKGLPLGNLTSQLLVNVYMNPFDQFVKHSLKARYCIRYADDFVILSDSSEWLACLIPRISGFLETQLRLRLHPGKISIRTVASGVDFLGWVQFPDHRVLRTTTKRRMLRRVGSGANDASRASYRGLLTHGNAMKLKLIMIL